MTMESHQRQTLLNLLTAPWMPSVRRLGPGEEFDPADPGVFYLTSDGRLLKQKPEEDEE